jgi:MbtH protein
MDEHEGNTSTRYVVVRNDEDQYSIWPVERDLPSGWHTADVTGTRQECLDHIDRVWTDMRPRSVRAAMAGGQSSP